MKENEVSKAARARRKKHQPSSQPQPQPQVTSHLQQSDLQPLQQSQPTQLSQFQQLQENRREESIWITRSFGGLHKYVLPSRHRTHSKEESDVWWCGQR